MKVRTITNIEVVSACDNKCAYCPAPEVKNHRYSGIMNMDIFRKTLHWVKHFTTRGTQGQVNLFGVGEPLLHPDIVQMVKLAREAVPMFGHIRVNTNGNNLTPDIAEGLKRAGITDVHVTDHKAETTVRALRILRDADIDHSTNRDFVTGANNWAGQVTWAPQIDYQIPCPWIGRGEVMVMADGGVTRCCLDAFGEGAMGTVEDNVADMDVTQFDLCEPCHHVIL